jgi:shikimate 5-dehydrogenase
MGGYLLNPSLRKRQVSIYSSLSFSSQDNLKPVVILDAGFASHAILALLEERGYSYIVNITRGSRSEFADSFEMPRPDLFLHTHVFPQRREADV